MLKVIFLALFLSLILGIFLLTLLQRKILFPTAYVSVSDSLPELENAEAMRIEFSDGSVDFLVLKSFIPKQKSGVVIFAHGNGESIDNWIEGLARYRKQGYHVALIEYRGYGRSTGSPSQVRITEDFVKAYDMLLARPDVDHEKIIFHGRSLGGGVVCSLAQHRVPSAMILESTFTSVDAMADSIFPFASLLVKDSFRSKDTLSKLPKLPLLVLHGTEDQVVPVSHAHALSDAVPNSKLVLYTAGHNDFPPNRAQYWAEIETFLTPD